MNCDILNSAKKLRNTEKWADTYISPDMTRKQREDAKELRQELRRRREAGEENLMIMRGRLVSKIRSRIQNDRQHERIDLTRETTPETPAGATGGTPVENTTDHQ